MRWSRLLLTVLAAVVLLASQARPADYFTDASRVRSYGGFGAGAWPSAAWRPYAADSPFNRLIDRADTVHPRSATIVRQILSWGRPSDLLAGIADTSQDYDRPIYFARSDDPIYTLVPTRPWGRNPIAGMRIRVPRGARAAGGSDGHLTVIQPDGMEYDLWQARRKPPRGGRLHFGWGGRLRIDGDGRGSGATASEFGSAAGIIRSYELQAGQIDHALALVVRCTGNDLGFGFGVIPARRHDQGSAFVYPASKGATACTGTSAGAPPTGARFRLNLGDEEIIRLPVPRWKKAILRALAHYGAYVADTGGAGFGFLAESGSSYTSFGRVDPMVEFARQAGLPRRDDGVYVMDIASGIDWERDLQVLTPPPRAETGSERGWGRTDGGDRLARHPHGRRAP